MKENSLTGQEKWLLSIFIIWGVIAIAAVVITANVVFPIAKKIELRQGHINLERAIGFKLPEEELEFEILKVRVKPYSSSTYKEEPDFAAKYTIDAKQLPDIIEKIEGVTHVMQNRNERIKVHDKAYNGGLEIDGRIARDFDYSGIGPNNQFLTDAKKQVYSQLYSELHPVSWWDFKTDSILRYYCGLSPDFRYKFYIFIIMVGNENVYLYIYAK